MDIEVSNKCGCVIAIGMSGTGKTTFVQKFYEKFNTYETIVHCINLDPAVKVINYKPFFDIRSTHDYKKVMKQYKLGPNGAILTALNLFTSQPQRIVDGIKLQIQKNKTKTNIIVIDIPGQIQVFTWSASSMILTQAISTLMPVRLLYIMDSVRCQNPNNFLSNLLFAQSIQYRLNQFDFLILFNKTDCGNGQTLQKWMTNYDEFLQQLGKDPTYLATLSKSIVIHLSDFYEKMKTHLISARTGKGFEKLEDFVKLKQLNVQKQIKETK